MPPSAVRCDDVRILRGAGTRSAVSDQPAIELLHATLGGQSDGGLRAPGRWQGAFEGPKPLHGHAPSAPAAHGCFEARTGPAATADAPSTVDGASGERGGGSFVDAQVVAAALAALASVSVAGSSSRTLSRLEELRDALSDLVDEAKAERAR